MVDTVGQLEGGLENMGSQIKGVVKTIMKGSGMNGFGYITPDDGGKNVYFHPFSLPSFNPNNESDEQIAALIQEFSEFSEGQKVIFNRRETQYGYEARNLILDTSEETSVLVPKTENAIVNVLEWTSESIEKFGPQIKGVIEIVDQRGFWYIKDENGKRYVFNTKGCVSDIDTFNELKDGMRVIFNEVERTDEMKATRGLKACNIMIDSPECSLEDETLRVDSTDWKEVMVQDSKGNYSLTVKANQAKDICELPNGVQLFTPAAMLREARRVGREKDVITGEQAQWLMKNSPNNIPEGCKFAGFIDSKGRLLFDGENACYWLGDVTEQGNQKALFCVDINKVDEELRPYTDEIIISDYDPESMMQVRLLKKKTV